MLAAIIIFVIGVVFVSSFIMIVRKNKLANKKMVLRQRVFGVLGVVSTGSLLILIFQVVSLLPSYVQ